MKIIPHSRPVPHLFIEKEFGNGFATNDAILNVIPYDPHILFVGTYNPRTPGNDVDFFYGRNYFWPTMFNIFIQCDVVRTQKRKYTIPITPTLDEILTLCTHTRMTFADLIKNTFHKKTYDELSGNVAYSDGKSYNLIADDALAQLDNLGHVNWGSDDIIKYIQETTSIHCVRLTRRPTGIWKKQWNRIASVNYGRDVHFGTIHTPSGMGLQERGVSIAKALARRWLFHPSTQKRLCDEWMENYHLPIETLNYTHPALSLV